MKKTTKILISLLLLVSIVCSFASCEYVDAVLKRNKEKENQNHEHVGCDCYIRTPDGYTGGVTYLLKFHQQYDVYWLETYDEVLEAIELLKSHGSTIVRTLGFSYDTELIDSKYCFAFEKEKAEPLEEGKNFFDRRIDDGWFAWYGFFDDITIDQLMYNNTVNDLGTAYLKGEPSRVNGGKEEEYNAIIDEIYTNGNVEDISFYDYMTETFGPITYPEANYCIYYKEDLKKEFAILRFYKNGKRVFLPVEYQREFLDTFVVIG